MKKIDAILFDFDGTLADTLPLIFYTFKELFRDYKKKELTPNDILNMFGPTEVGIIKKEFTECKEGKEEIIAKFYKIYEEKHPEFMKKEDDFLDLLDYLKKIPLKIGIVTGKGSDTLKISLKLLKMERYFDVLISGDDVKTPKPDPEGAIKAMQLLDVRPERTLFVGDSDADIGAGKGANVLYTIGVDWLSNVIKMNLKPDYFFSDVKEFKEFIKELVGN